MASPRITKTVERVNKELYWKRKSRFIKRLMESYFSSSFFYMNDYLHSKKKVKTWYVGYYGDSDIMPMTPEEDRLWNWRKERKIVKVIFKDDTYVFMSLKTFKKYARKFGDFIWL